MPESVQTTNEIALGDIVKVKFSPTHYEVIGLYGVYAWLANGPHATTVSPIARLQFIERRQKKEA